MSPEDITVEVIDINLRRQGQILPKYLAGFTCKSQLRAVGEWTLPLPAELDMAEALNEPGAGILVTGPRGELFSGPVAAPTEKADQDDPAGTITFTGPDFLCIPADDAAYPDPAHPANAQTLAYDTRTGPAETVIRSLISANIGPAAPAARRAAFALQLELEDDQHRGQVVTSSTRFDPLLDTVASLGNLAGLGFRIEASGGRLLLRFWEPQDQSKTVRLDIRNGTLDDYEYKRSVPALTRALVAGQGEGAARTIIERTNSAALAAEAAWGRRIVQFVDQRNTDDVTELEQAGDEALADGGATGEQLTVSPSDVGTMQFQNDWGLGDIVTVVTSRGEVAQVVTKTMLGIGPTGVLIGAEVGPPDPAYLRALQLRRRVRRLETRT